MSTAYAPRVTIGSTGNNDVTGSDETLVSSIGIGGTTNVQVDLWVHGIVVAQAGADTTAAVITAYLGPFALGNSIGSITYTDAALDGGAIPLSFDFTTEIGEGDGPTQIDITIAYTDASADGGALTQAAIATVF